VPEFLYHIACPRCGTTFELLDSSLVGIVQNRRESTTGEPFVTFVCGNIGCRAAFQYDYQHRGSPPGKFQPMIEEGLHTTKLRSQIRYSTSAGCDDSSRRTNRNPLRSNNQSNVYRRGVGLGPNRSKVREWTPSGSSRPKDISWTSNIG
jgi:hypothetical protein